MSVFVFDNILEVMNKFEEYKAETQSKWRKIESRGPLFLQPGPDTYETIDHLTTRGSSNYNRFLNWAPLRSLNDHTPYVSIGRHIYGCFYGVDPSRPRKIKNLEKEMEYMSEQERKEAAEERQSFLEMADVQCPARARLFYVIKFPTLKTHVHEKRKAMAQLFDKIMKTNPLQLHVKHTYVMELPHETSHSDHPCPDFSITSNNRIGDRALHDAVQWYMQGREEGISHVVINTDDTSDFMSDAKEEFSTSTPNSVDEIAQKIMNQNKKTFSSRKIHPVNNEDHEDELRSLVSKTEKIKETMQPSSSGIQTVKHHCQTQSSTNSSDPDEFFLLSLVPQFKMLSPRKASEVRIEFLKVLHKAQFESK